jgi:MFS family permease
MPNFLQSLEPVERLTWPDRRRGRIWLRRNGVAAQIMETLSYGTFLVAFAVELGATNFLIGLFAAIPHLVQIAHIPGVYLIERVRKRRLVAVVAGALSRPMLLVTGAAALVADRDLALVLLGIGIGGRYFFGAIVGSAWNGWIRDVVPDRSMGRIFAERLMLMSLVGSVLALLAGVLVDHWTTWTGLPTRQAYAVLLAAAFVGGVVSVYSMAKIPEPRMAPSAGPVRLRTVLAQPFKDRNFRRLIVFLGSWNFAVNLAAPFFAVHMLKRLQLDLTVIVALTVVSQAANIIVTRKWGRIADRFSNKSVLAVCGPLFIACIFAWTLTSFPERHAFTIPLLVAIHVLAGISTAGVTLASGTIGLKLAPTGEATAYLATTSLVNSAAAGLAPIIGGVCADFFLERELSLAIKWTAPAGELVLQAIHLQKWDFFFITAGILGFYSLHRLALVREVGEVSERVVLAELALGARRAIRSLSTVAGLRAATEFPLEMLRRAVRRHRVRAPSTARPAAP